MHVPLNFVGEDKTFHMINEKTLKRVSKGAWFINSSRGEVAETGALISALNSGRLAGAVIDVWENEPDLDLSLMQKAFIAHRILQATRPTARQTVRPLL
jgi:erythronate-4-phosphate dehydrogenase